MHELGREFEYESPSKVFVKDIPRQDWGSKTTFSAEASEISSAPEIISTFPDIPLMNQPSFAGGSPAVFQPITEFSLLDSVYVTHLEQHLFHLSYICLQAVPMSASDKLKILSPSGVSPSICKALKYSLFSTAVIFSTHPDLFPAGNSGMKQRIDVSKTYASRAIKCINQALQNLQFVTIPDVFSKPGIDDHFQLPYEKVDPCDLIRAMLCLAPYAYGIGDGGTGIRLIRESIHVASMLGLFELIDGEATAKPLWSIDSFVFRVPHDKMATRPQTVPDEQERFTLWASCLVFDTYCSMESGHVFSLDERMFPEFVAGWRPKVFNETPAHPPVRKPTQATNTIWENGPYSAMFDRVSDICTYDLYPHATSSTFNYVVWICVILRRILRVVRARVPINSDSPIGDKWWSSQTGLHPSGIQLAFMKLPRDVSYEQLHNSLLLWYANLTDRARAFPSLEVFTDDFNEPPGLDSYYTWSFAAPALEGTLLFLSGFSYLHMGYLDNPNSEKRFRLSLARYTDINNLPENPKLFSSRQVLMATLKAVAYLMKRLLKTTDGIHPASIFPSPIQYWAIQPLELFIISTSGLLASRIPPFSEKDFIGALNLVNKYILPTLQQFCNVWPMASHYKAKLESLVTSLQIQ
ncbi:hypothetical protein HDV06_002870 [Boothiomyces sp. JEL0866]|nr:hypothetical protein HDV06_002870 [Boothiomyces sp. JEL0866]